MTHNRITDEWLPDPQYVRVHEDDVREAEAFRRDLIAEAEKTMAGWVLDLNLGLISEEDKQKLIAWRLYVKALDALELDAATGIEWPLKPEI
ncbi:TPA: tail fiber assembly protein [Kluyvera ascorbata]|nr:tail fiber assembly protein [Kluyvera ascorbata]